MRLPHRRSRQRPKARSRLSGDRSALQDHGLAAGYARVLVAEGSPTAGALLDQMVATHHAMIADVRRLVDGLRPPALDQLGLAAAVTKYAESLGCHRGAHATAAGDGENDMVTSDMVTSDMVTSDMVTGDKVASENDPDDAQRATALPSAARNAPVRRSGRRAPSRSSSMWLRTSSHFRRRWRSPRTGSAWKG